MASAGKRSDRGICKGLEVVLQDALSAPHLFPTFLFACRHLPVLSPGFLRGSMETPCINVCVIDAGTGLCAGCGRSLDEIARWSAMTDDERRRIMAVLAGRRRCAEAER